jgi:hypothetical protein
MGTNRTTPGPRSRTIEWVWAYAREGCNEVWRVPSAPTASRRPLQADIPTLLISGTSDSPTSPRCAKQAARVPAESDADRDPRCRPILTVPRSKCAEDPAAPFQSNLKAPHLLRGGTNDASVCGDRAAAARCGVIGGNCAWQANRRPADLISARVGCREVPRLKRPGSTTCPTRLP